MYKLTRDIYSIFKKKLYGKAGTKVKLISDKGNVWIVEDEGGNRFSVVIEDLIKIK